MRHSSLTHIPTPNNEREEAGMKLRAKNLSVLDTHNNSDIGLLNKVNYSIIKPAAIPSTVRGS